MLLCWVYLLSSSSLLLDLFQSFFAFSFSPFYSIIIFIGRIFIQFFCCAFNNQHGKIERALCLRSQFVCLLDCVCLRSSPFLSHTHTSKQKKTKKEIYVQYCAVLHFLFTIKWQYLYEYTSMELALEALYVHTADSQSAVCILSHHRFKSTKRKLPDKDPCNYLNIACWMRLEIQVYAPEDEHARGKQHNTMQSKRD